MGIVATIFPDSPFLQDTIIPLKSQFGSDFLLMELQDIKNRRKKENFIDTFNM